MNPLYNGWIRRHRGPDETRRPAPWRPTRPSRTICGRGSRTVRRARHGVGDPATAVAWTCSQASSSASCGRRIRSDGRMGSIGSDRQAAHGAVRRLGLEGPPRRIDVGGSRPRPARVAPRRRRHARPDHRGAVCRRASRDHGSRPARAPDARARPGARGGAPRRRGPTSRGWHASAENWRSSGRSRPGICRRVARRSGSTPSPKPGRRPTSRGEVRRDPRCLRADRHRRAALRRPAPHTGGVPARTRARAARGCYGAPDRIRTCDLRLRRPTLYPLSYRRAGGRRFGAARPDCTPVRPPWPRNIAVPVKDRPITPLGAPPVAPAPAASGRAKAPAPRPRHRRPHSR